MSANAHLGLSHRHSPPRQIAAGLATASLLFLLGAGAAFSKASHAPIVFSIDPAAASPGDVVVLTGEGLHEGGDEAYAWVRSSSGGFVLENPSDTGDGGLAAIVGPVASASTGTVELWRGRGLDVPPSTLWVDGRLVSALESRVFVAHVASSGGPSFSALKASAATVEVPAEAGRFVTDVDDWFPLPVEPLPTVRVDAVIETGGSTNCGGGGPLLTPARPFKASTSGGQTPPSWALQVVVEPDRPFIGPAGSWSAASLAAALAAVLTEQFSSLGLTATADGSRLVIESAGGICGGFVTISP